MMKSVVALAALTVGMANRVDAFLGIETSCFGKLEQGYDPAASCLSSGTRRRHSSLLQSSPSDYFGDPATKSLAPEISSATVDLPGTDASTTTTAPSSGKVQRLHSLSDFLDFIDSAPTDTLVVIKFFGNSCPLCRKIEMKYKKMARDYKSIAFAEIEKTAHPDLCKILGIEALPFIQIYRNGQCVASHGTESDKTFEPIVKDTINRELAMTPEDWNSFLTTFAGPIQASADKLDYLRYLTSL